MGCRQGEIIKILNQFPGLGNNRCAVAYDETYAMYSGDILFFCESMAYIQHG